ncbi:MAG: response regulator [Candidatus Heimdallarchaeota archaeon]|nr:response regulator [Candidatus Heimdallarchaeota archaeon]
MANVFIVEDEIRLQKIYETILQCIGHQIVGQAYNGEEAVEMIKSFTKKPDIIIMDHRMPKKNGIEATKEILKIDNSIKIIFASADNTALDKAIAVGAISFKTKPFTIEYLKSNIDKALKK